MNQNPCVICSAFIEKDGKFLVVLCPKYKVWRVPGGRPQSPETMEQALIREMKEEVGLDFNKPHFLGYGEGIQYQYVTKRDVYLLAMFFHVKTNQEIKLGLDPEEVPLQHKWLSYEELKKIENKEEVLISFLEKNPELKI